MAVADDAAVGQEAELGLGADPVQPGDDGAVDLARMVEIVATGDNEHAFARELRRIGDLQLAAAHILALKPQLRWDRQQARGVARHACARKEAAVTHELARHEIGTAHHRRSLVGAHTPAMRLDLEHVAGLGQDVRRPLDVAGRRRRHADHPVDDVAVELEQPPPVTTRHRMREQHDRRTGAVGKAANERAQPCDHRGAVEFVERDVSAAARARPIRHRHAIAARREAISPAGPVVDRALIAGAAVGAAVHHHHRRLLCRGRRREGFEIDANWGVDEAVLVQDRHGCALIL